ncbi:MipA/OmpV family protein [Yoonia vestfoldensis]|uniref:MipA/OmpV family protein n=1 Tax=Yoonia vestfoldensis TaxID=245188 RepID=UPI000373FA6A|nr:MipA/OmpV family protein [Yoonia vestfoldensis]
MRGIFIVALCCPTLALAQSENEIGLTIGLGVQSAPSYFGADSNDVGPTGSFALDQLDFNGLSVGSGAGAGFSFGGSLRYIAAREAVDHSELQGLTDIDAAIELGGGLRYVGQNFDAFANLRNGFGGHDSVVADFGIDFIQPLGSQWELRAGPRALWGSEDYAQTYFGVTEAESNVSAFAQYDAGAGLVRAGLAASLTYQATPDWGVVGRVLYEELQGDAAGSPIVQRKDQTSVSLVVTRRVSFGF